MQQKQKDHNPLQTSIFGWKLTGGVVKWGPRLNRDYERLRELSLDKGDHAENDSQVRPLSLDTQLEQALSSVVLITILKRKLHEFPL